MAEKNKGPQPPPKRPAGKLNGSAQDRLWYWVINQYFDYHGQKQTDGGFPAEFIGRLEWGVGSAPAITSRELLLELLRQYGQTVWRLDPATPDSAAKAAASGDGEASTDASPNKGDGDAIAPEDTTEKEEPSERENDLFSVAGVPLPPSLTVPANVPGGYKQVLRRYSTLRILQIDLAVREMKTAESIAATKAQVEAVARIAAKVGSDRDELLWQFRDGQQPPSAGFQQQPTV